MSFLSPPLLSVLLLAHASLSGQPRRPLRAELDERALREGWSDRAELAFTLADGNAGFRSYGFRNTLALRADRNLFFLDAGGHRAVNTRTERVAVGDDVRSARLLTRDVTTVSAQRFFVRGKFDRDVGASFFLFGAGGWEANRFSGIRGRSFVSAGVGNRWLDSPRAFWRTDYGFARFQQKRTSRDVSEGFPGLRSTSTLTAHFSQAGRFDNHSILEVNLERARDYRVDTTNALSFRLRSALALKASVQLVYANERDFDVVFLERPTGQLTGERVTFQLRSLDTFVTIALVLDF